MARTVIIGAGVTGVSCARHLAGTDDVLVLDTRASAPGAQALAALGVELRLDVEEHDFSTADRVIVSPGVALESCLVGQAVRAGLPLASDIDLFFEAARAPVFLVTGTNGKSTVTSMAAALLRAGGVDAVAGGNLGDAALDVLDAGRQAYVLELSSFQLERLGQHAREAAVLLNVTDDHLDRHGSFASYLGAKHRVFEGAARCVWNRDDAATKPRSVDAGISSVSFGLDPVGDGDGWGLLEQGAQLWFCRGDEKLLPVAELALPGTHNQANFLAACALVGGTGLQLPAMTQVARSFRGLPHRCAFVEEINGVRYIDDSKATNVGAAVSAVAGIASTLSDGARIVLIAGGEGKGADFSPLGTIQAKLRHVALIGRDAAQLAAVLDAVHYSMQPSMEAAVAAARDQARPGDVVLLSPACASFDMFDNFEHRGRRFEELVQAMLP